MLLTSQELQTWEASKISSRFKGTFIVLSQDGLVYVSDVTREGMYIKRVNKDNYHRLSDEDSVLVHYNNLNVERAAPARLGYINSPQGVVTVEDLAERQWTWGVSPRRYRFKGARGDSIEDIAAMALALFDMETVIFFNQFTRGNSYAISHDFQVTDEGVKSHLSDVVIGGSLEEDYQMDLEDFNHGGYHVI
jgi:hypothetical protein